MYQEDELIRALKNGYHFTEPIPQLKSFYPTPAAREHVSKQLAEIYKSYLIRSVLSLKSIENLLDSLSQRLKTFAPFTDVSLYYVRDRNSQNSKEKSPPINQILISNNLEAFHWYPKKTILYHVTFASASKVQDGEEVQFQTSGLELPLVWFQYSCRRTKQHGLWKACCNDQFVMLVLKESKRNSPTFWNSQQMQSTCTLPIPEPKVINEKLLKLNDKEYRATLMKQNPHLCEFDIGLYESVLQLALPEEDRVDLPKLEKNGEDDKSSLPKCSPATETRSDEDLIRGIQQERLATELLRKQMEKAERVLQKSQEEQENLRPDTRSRTRQTCGTCCSTKNYP